MKRFLQIAIAAAMGAVAMMSCGGKEKPATLTADNSYIVNKTETPIVWAGAAESNTNVYTIYLAASVPASTESPVTINGVTVTFPASLLGNEITLGSAGTAADLDGAAITGKIKVAISGVRLVVDITAAQVSGSSFLANYDGEFEELSSTPQLPTLVNSFKYNGVTTTITCAAVQSAVGAGYDDYNIRLGHGDFVNGQLALATLPFVQMFVKKSDAGRVIDLSIANPDEEDYWIIYALPEVGQATEFYGDENVLTDIVSGALQYTFDGTTLTIACTITYTNSKTFEFAYSGPLTELVVPDGPNVPDLPEATINKWTFNGTTSFDVVGAYYLFDGGYNCYEIGLSPTAVASGGIVGNLPESVCFSVPAELAGAEIDLGQKHTAYQGRDFWYAQVSTALETQYGFYWATEEGDDDIINGKLKYSVNTGNNTVSIQFVVNFVDGNQLIGGYSGAAQTRGTIIPWAAPAAAPQKMQRFTPAIDNARVLTTGKTKR